MRNITVSVPDEVYRRARIHAARRDTSVSRLVRGFLVGLDENDDFARRKRLQDEVIASVDSFRASDRLSRDEVHDRAALR